MNKLIKKNRLNIIASIIVGVAFCAVLPILSVNKLLFLVFPIALVINLISLNLLQKEQLVNNRNYNPFQLMVIFAYLIYVCCMFKFGIPYKFYAGINGEVMITYKSLFPDKPLELETSRLVMSFLFATILFSGLYFIFGYFKSATTVEGK